VTVESGHFSTKTAVFRPTLFTQISCRCLDRVVLVHGSVGTGSVTWSAQTPLADRFDLVIVERSGYPPNPPQERIDFAGQADELLELLRPGDHLVGHSYGGVVALLAAARADIRSLTVNEPPAFGLARKNPAVEEFLAKMKQAPSEPREYLEYFLPFPKLVVTGAHNPALDAVADVLERRLPAARVVLPGAGHNLPRALGYNETLTRFFEAA
jgi:pimeloyl-ACP methyl ester carboxylesterase